MGNILHQPISLIGCTRLTGLLTSTSTSVLRTGVANTRVKIEHLIIDMMNFSSLATEISLVSLSYDSSNAHIFKSRIGAGQSQQIMYSLPNPIIIDGSTDLVFALTEGAGADTMAEIVMQYKDYTT